MRRASFTPAFKVSVDEPLIVVDESEELENSETSPKSIEEEVDDDKDSPDNPYLLSPWRDARDTRKHSLPNIQCTGITASQVRRLSDGGDNAPTAKEMAFLAKLSQVIYILLVVLLFRFQLRHRHQSLEPNIQFQDGDKLLFLFFH